MLFCMLKVISTHEWITNDVKILCMQAGLLRILCKEPNKSLEVIQSTLIHNMILLCSILC